MRALTFKLESFEGPLDLLLHLISKHKLNIYDIEITVLLEQYLEYIDSLDEQDFDTAGDFLAMAARLVYIKTCSLLPQAEEAEEMKKELTGELIEYSVCKEAAATLHKLCVYGEVFVRPPEKLAVNKVFTGNMQPQQLVMVYMSMTSKARRMRPVRAEAFSPIVAARIVTVTSKIVYVLKKLYKCGECTVEELYRSITDRSARVATFLAVLELTKSGRIFLNDDNTLIIFNRNTPRRHAKNDNTQDDERAEELPQEDTEVTAHDGAQSGAFDVQNETLALPQEQLTSDIYSDREKTLAQKKSSAPRYALESIDRPRSAAIPVFLSLQSDDLTEENEPPKTDEQTEDIYEYIGYIPSADETQGGEPDKVSERYAAVKENRFSLRVRWRYPADISNCWRYGRERS